MIALIIAFLKTTAGVLTSISIIGTAIIFLVRWAKKGLVKIIKDQICPVQEEIKKVSTDITQIKETNNNQMEKINQLLENQAQLGLTDKHILRALITGKYYEYCIDKKYLPMYERECLALLYEDYKGLKGNTFIDNLYEQMLGLPSESTIS